MIVPILYLYYNASERNKQRRSTIMDKLFIITGAYGHLGNTIMRLLLQDNVSIRGLVLPSEKLPAYSQVEYVQGDVCDIESLEPYLQILIINQSMSFIQPGSLVLLIKHHQHLKMSMFKGPKI